MSKNGLKKYKAAEDSLWQYLGVKPKEYFLNLEKPQVKVRVQEVGEGNPVLFVHGGPNASTTWAPLVASLQDFRCIALDRPGCGLSDPVDYISKDLRSLAVDVLVSVLDALEIIRLPLVASSIGGTWGFWLAQAHPQRVSRLVQMGCPALIDDMKIPIFMRLMAVPGLNRLMTRVMPVSVASTRNLYQQIGHGASVEAGSIPDLYFDWACHLIGDTNTMQNELDLIERALTWKGTRSELLFDDEDMRRVPQPTLFIWGDADPFGGVEVARRAVAIMDDAVVDIIPQSGHLPWLDATQDIADLTSSFLLQENPGPRAVPRVEPAAYN